MPAFILTPHVADFGAAVSLVERTERRAHLDRLQLLRIADEHDLGACIGGVAQHPFHLPRADHARFVDHEHIARGEHVASPRPAIFETGNGARGDAQSMLQPFGGDPRQGGTADIKASAFPGFARDAEHRALARSGIADNDAQAALVGHMLECLTLLAAQRQAAPLHLRQSTFSVGLVDAIPFARCHCFGSAVQPLFGVDHAARREPIVAAPILAKFDQLGR